MTNKWSLIDWLATHPDDVRSHLGQWVMIHEDLGIICSDDDKIRFDEKYLLFRKSVRNQSHVCELTPDDSKMDLKILKRLEDDTLVVTPTPSHYDPPFSPIPKGKLSRADVVIDGGGAAWRRFQSEKRDAERNKKELEEFARVVADEIKVEK